MGCCKSKGKSILNVQDGSATVDGTCTSMTATTSDAGSRRVDIFNFKTIPKDEVDDKRRRVENEIAEGPQTKAVLDVTQGKEKKADRLHVQLDPVGRVVKARKDKSAIEARKSHKRDDSGAKPETRRRELVVETIEDIGGHILDRKTGKQKYIEAKSETSKQKAKDEAKSKSKSRSKSESTSTSTGSINITDFDAETL